LDVIVVERKWILTKKRGPGVARSSFFTKLKIVDKLLPLILFFSEKAHCTSSYWFEKTFTVNLLNARSIPAF